MNHGEMLPSPTLSERMKVLTSLSTLLGGQSTC